MLVAFLLKVHSVVRNWGIAIIVLTITARTLLFPLALPSIKGMIKMRELKPELDALNEKFKDDAQAKGLAQMELWRKHNVNPLKGCLPQLASMPVWFALYTTLQTAVELYNIPFLWFPDLSQPDPLYILPFIIGATSFFQQKLMPMQGDPMQQKMMLYFMPAMFTVFMLFLPAGLGVYMFTNGVLGIVQQQAVEWHVRRTMRSKAARAASPDTQVKVGDDTARRRGPRQGQRQVGKGRKEQGARRGCESLGGPPTPRQGKGVSHERRERRSNDDAVGRQRGRRASTTTRTTADGAPASESALGRRQRTRDARRWRAAARSRPRRSRDGRDRRRARSRRRPRARRRSIS